VILHGLEQGEHVLLAPPADGDKIPLIRLPENQRPRRDTTAATHATPARAAPAHDSTPSAPRRPAAAPHETPAPARRG
jgi:hypothetical protein